MKRIEKPSAMEVAATALADAIRTGSLAGRLPGTRVLAARLGVSAPTVAAALARLADDGVLVKSGERRAYRVAGRGNSRTKASSHGKIRNRLLILTHADIGQLVEFSRRLLEKLRDVMAGKGWTVDHQVVDFLHVKRPRRAWDRLIGIDPHTSVIALYGRGPLAEWAVRRKVRILFLGGNADGLPVPVLAVAATD